MHSPRPKYSSKSFLVFLLISNFILGNSSPIQAQEEPIFILETNNKIKARGVSAPDQTIKVQAGAALMGGAKVKLDEREELLILNDGEFQWVNGEGEHVLEHEEDDSQLMSFNFDPTFAEYVKASYSITMSNIAPDRFDLTENKNLGDGWGVTGGGSGSGGWGVTGGGGGSGGWGVTGGGSGSGGWGVTGGGSGSGGWGVTGGGSGSGGWGVTGGGNGSGGWGIQNPNSWGGWGVSDPTGSGAWGVTGGGSGSGGWGVTGGGSESGGWGVVDPTGTDGWGVTGGGSGSGGWGVTGGGSGSGGWGKDDMSIFSMIPGGKYKQGNNTFAWIGHKDVDMYLVCIFDENLNVVAKEVTNSSRVVMDLSSLELGKAYYWQVFAKDKKAISTPISFNVISDQDFLEVKESAKISDIYTKVGPEIQGLMTAAAFETNKLFAESKSVFDRLLAKYPKNDLVRMCYAAYSMRMGQPLVAKKNIEKI